MRSGQQATAPSGEPPTAPAGPPFSAHLLATGALLTVVLLQVARVWLPSIAFVPSPTTATTGLVRTTATAAVVGGALAVVSLTPSARLVRVLLPATALLVLARLVLQTTPGGLVQLSTAGVGLFAGVLALASWSQRTEGHLARVAVFGGVAAETALWLAGGTLDLAWRDGVGVLPLVAALAVGTLVTAHRAAALSPDVALGAPISTIWPWLVTGLTVALVLMLSGPPGRATAASGWPHAMAVGGLAAAHLAAALAAWAGPRIGPTRCAMLGAGLTLLGAAGALQPGSRLVLPAQAAVAVGCGLAVAAVAAVRARGSRPHAAPATALAWLVALVLPPGYLLWHQSPTRLDSRYLLIVVAAAIGVLALGGARRAVGDGLGPGAPPPRALPAVGAVLGLGLATATTAALVTPAPAAATVPDDREGLTIAVLSQRLGHDTQGRFDPLGQADALAAMAPDVVALTETGRGWPATGGHDTLRLLGDRLGLPTAAATPADHLRGQALLTGLPVTDLGRQTLPRAPRGTSSDLLSSVLQLHPDQRLAVVVARLEAGEDAAEQRRRQARVVAAEVARLRSRGLEVVLLGDLQAEPHDPELAPLDELLSPALPHAEATWPAQHPRRQLLHVMVTDGVDVLGWERGTEPVADQLPVAVRVGVSAPG